GAGRYYRAGGKSRSCDADAGHAGLSRGRRSCSGQRDGCRLRKRPILSEGQDYQEDRNQKESSVHCLLVRARDFAFSATSAVIPVASRTRLLGSGTADTSPETVRRAKSASGVRVEPDEGRIVAVKTDESAVKVVLSESKKLCWLNVAENTADENSVV